MKRMGISGLLLLTASTFWAGELTAPQKKSLEKTVRQFIRQESENGVFVVHDEKLDKDWKLKLVRLHTERVSQLDQKLYSVCGDFKQARSRKTLDIDFLMNATDTGWDVRKAVIHMVDGQARVWAQPGATGALPRPGAEQASYTCPMHPDVVSDKPGKCPKCGMDLQKR